MKEEKSFWEKLKRWIDGDEVLLDADEIISKKEKKEFIYEERIFPIGDIRSNVTLYCVLSVFVTVVFIAVMLHVVMELPMFGDPNSITNNEVAARYLEKGIAETGAINFVAGMILDYRAFDTFGESNVLFMAVIAVLMLLQRDKKNIDAAEDQEMQEDEMLDLIAIAQSAPGAIAVNGAIVVGFKLAGVLGAVTAIAASIIPPFLIITVISYFYELFRDNYIVSSVLSGMQAGVGAVIASVVLDMGGGVLKQKSVLSIAVMLTAFIATYVYKVNAVYIILACIAIGVVRTVVQQRRNAQ